jgi:CubicO group peptidase (beta-lactamase class C family)
MGDYVPEVKEEIKVDEEAPDMFEKLEKLIRFQLSSEELPVRDVLTAFGTPIVSVGILDAGTTTGKVLGNPRPGAESTESFDNETLFQAASISKAVTALAVLKLCQFGELDLDAPISRYLSSVSASLYDYFFPDLSLL